MSEWVVLGGWRCPAAQGTVGQAWDKKQGVGEYQGVTTGITSIIGYYWDNSNND